MTSIVEFLATTPLPHSNLWVGLDRTDDGPTNQIRISEVKLVPDDPATNTWEIAGVCILTNTVGKKTEYWTMDKEACSASYLDQKLTGIATVTNPPPGITLSVSTNFTVVKVDVSLSGLVETNEETVGACLPYQADATNDIWTVEGTNALMAVSINCWPVDLPSNEMVKIEAPEGFLYEKIGDVYTNAQTFYQASEVNKKLFFLHGHVTSGGLRDGTIAVTHETSKAKDMAKFTVFDIRCAFSGGAYILVEDSNVTFNQDGVSQRVKLIPEPDPILMNPIWDLLGSQGEVRWKTSSESSDFFETGTGDNPYFYIKFKQNPILANGTPDYMPPNNSEFGRKKYSIVVQIASLLTIAKTVRIVSFAGSGLESKMMDGKQVSAWYYYYLKNNAVQGLEKFEYNEVLSSNPEDSTKAGWNPYLNTFKIARCAYSAVSKGRIISVETNGVVEKSYNTAIGYGKEWPDYNGIAAHGVAKTVFHEEIHQLLASEIVYYLIGTVLWRQNDTDWDGLPFEREIAFGSDPDKKDSFKFCLFEGNPEGGGSGYEAYADQEVYCRINSQAVVGIDNLDWEKIGHNVSCVNSEAEGGK